MPKSEASIIEIIEKMVKDGEPEEKILKSLVELGVEPEKAKRLLLLGQADTFALLRREIKSIVEQEIEAQKPVLKKFIEEQTIEAAYRSRQELTKAVITDLKDYERDVTGHNKKFEDQVNQNIKYVVEVADKTKEKLNEMGEVVSQIQTDMDEIRVKGVGGRNRLIATILWVLGILFGLVALYLIIINLDKEVSIDRIILSVSLALISVTMLFAATWA
ncbi:MAG: hypothetical protein QXZ13_00830 [Candidatus Diapherotrites archaeon]